MWGLGILARKDADGTAREVLVALVSDQDAEVRAQAAQCLGEVSGIDGKVLVPLLRDESNRVRAFGALALARQKYAVAAPELVTMLEENGGKDLYVAHAGVMGLLGTAEESQIANLVGNPSAAVRMAAVVALRRLSSPLLEKFLNDADPKVADEAIRAIHEAPVEAARPAVAALLDGYFKGGGGRAVTPMIARRMIHSAFRVGGTKNAERLVKVALSEKIGMDERQEALRLLQQWTEPFPVDQSLGLWAPLEKRNVSELLPVLKKGLPLLLESDRGLTERSLQLLDVYELPSGTVPAATFEKIAKDSGFPDGARTAALELFLKGNPANAGAVMVTLVNDPSDLVSSAALGSLVKIFPEKAKAGVEAALKSENVARRQAAWASAAALPGEESVDLIVKALAAVTAGKGDAAALLELREAAGKRPEEAVKVALAAYEKSLDVADPLSPWLAALEGGDIKNGAELFKNHGAAQCMRCHRAEDSDEGGVMVGPNLLGIGGRHDAHYILQSIMNPGAAVASGYGIISLTLNNGKSIGGILQGETADSFDVIVGPDTWRVKKSDVKASTPPVSAMPPMTAMLTVRETRDLVAYLADLKAQREHPPEVKEPKPYVLE